MRVPAAMLAEQKGPSNSSLVNGIGPGRAAVAAERALQTGLELAGS
jgi:hypothetical protein